MSSASRSPIAMRRTFRMLTGSLMGPCSGEGAMPRGSWIAWTTTAVVLACAGCTLSKDPPPVTPSTSSPSASPSASSSSPSPTVPSYLAKFTPTQRRAYDQALVARIEFDREQAKILASGKATGDAKRFYRRSSGDWLSYWNRLRQREADGIRVLGRGETLSIKPSAIRLGDQSGTIDIRVCGVARGVKVLQSGEPIPQPRATPRIVNVRLIKLE